MEWEQSQLNSDSAMITQTQEKELTKSNPSVHAAVDPGLCMFETKSAESAVSKVEYVEYSVIGSLENQNTLEFRVSKSSQYYWNLRKSVIAMKCRIIKESGQAIEADDRVAFVQAPGYSLFKSCDFLIQQRNLSPHVGEHYGMKNVLDLLLYSPEEYLESEAQNFLYYKDVSPMDSTDMSGVGINSGLVSRYEYTSGGKEVEIEVPVGTDLWSISSYIPVGVELFVRLHLQDPTYVLMYGSPTERYKYQITMCNLKMYGLTLSTQALAKHTALLGKQRAMIHFNRSEIKTFTIPPGVMTWDQSGIFTNHVPFEIVVCFVESTAASGDVKKNPYNFKHHNINYLSIKIDNYERKTFQPNFANFHCVAEYNALYDREDPNIPVGNVIKRHEFHKGYAIFRYVIAPASYERLSRSKTGETSLSMRLSSSVVADGLICIIYGRFHDYFMLDKDKKVISSDQC